MLIQSNLFSKGHPLKVEPRLSQLLEGHKQGVLVRIKTISALDEMTDSFLAQLVKDSLVDTLMIEFDKMTKKLRTEGVDGSMLPNDTVGARWFRNGRGDPLDFFDADGKQKQVARLSIPFNGDPVLLQYSPSTCGLTFPRGEVSDNRIQFDVILWGGSDEDNKRVRDEIKANCDLMETYAARINDEVKQFNESLPSQVRAAFDAKLHELSKQHSVFDDLGIPDEPESPVLPTASVEANSKRRENRATQIIQFIANQYVRQLNQSNNNVGDVNNAIQSNQQ